MYFNGVHFTYLGLDVGGNPSRKEFWEPILNKISARIIIWKERFLSFAGRLCLIKSVFSTLPLFYFSFYKAPVSVCNRIISIHKRFMWAWERDQTLISWVSWENICKPMEEGMINPILGTPQMINP